MNVTVLLPEIDDRHETLDAGIVLSELFDGNLELLTTTFDQCQTGAIHERLRNLPTERTPSLRSLESKSLPEAMEHHSRSSTILVVSSPIVDSAESTTMSLSFWNGPVFLIPGGGGLPRRDFAKRIIALTGDPGGRDIPEQWIRTFALKASSHVTLLSVLNPNGASDQVLEDRFFAARQGLGQNADRLRRSNLNVGWEIRLGVVEDEVKRLAETTGTGLVLLPPPAFEDEGYQLASSLADGSRLYVLSDGRAS